MAIDDISVTANAMGGMQYTTTLTVEEGNHEYKYFLVEDQPTWEFSEWPGDPLREVDVSGVMTVYDVWGEYAPPVEYTLTLQANPNEGGTYSGQGSYEAGETVNITATANDGYSFLSWTDENNNIISDDANFTYTMPASDKTLTANFVMIEYNVIVFVDPAGSGSVTGSGVYNMNDLVSLVATESDGFEFLNWTDDNNVVLHNSATYSFYMPASDLTLTANFIPHTGIDKDVLSDKIKLFPNPAQNEFNITSVLMINRVLITDVNGRVVYEKNIGDKETRVSTTNFKPGLYFVRIYTNEEVFIKTIGVQP